MTEVENTTDPAGDAPVGEKSPPVEPTAPDPANGRPRRRAPRSRAKAVPLLTPAESAARGKAERAEVGRSLLGDWEPPSNRRNPVDLLEEQAAGRVTELVPIRYGRVLVSPFAFFRGAAYVMASDLAELPKTRLHVQLRGDAEAARRELRGRQPRPRSFESNPGSRRTVVNLLSSCAPVSGPQALTSRRALWSRTISAGESNWPPVTVWTGALARTGAATGTEGYKATPVRPASVPASHLSALH